MFRPIETFPYDKTGNMDINLFPTNTDELMVFKTKNTCSPDFAIGYYNNVHDVFHIWYEPGYQDSPEYSHDRHGIANGNYVILPIRFRHAVGPRIIEGYAKLSEIMETYQENNKFIHVTDDTDITYDGLAKKKLLILKSGNVLLSSVHRFVGGDAFQGTSPTAVNGSEYHVHGAISKDKIQCFADIE